MNRSIINGLGLRCALSRLIPPPPIHPLTQAPTHPTARPIPRTPTHVLGSNLAATMSNAASAASKRLQVLSPKSVSKPRSTLPLDVSDPATEWDEDIVGGQGRPSLAPLVVFRQLPSGQGEPVKVESTSGHEEQVLGGSTTGGVTREGGKAAGEPAQAMAGGEAAGESAQAMAAETRARDNGQSSVCVIC